MSVIICKTGAVVVGKKTLTFGDECGSGTLFIYSVVRAVVQVVSKELSILIAPYVETTIDTSHPRCGDTVSHTAHSTSPSEISHTSEHGAVHVVKTSVVSIISVGYDTNLIIVTEFSDHT